MMKKNNNKLVISFIVFVQLISFNLYAFEVSMKGDLDDDLIIIKASPTDWNFMDCLQMHNPTNIFSLDGKSIKSTHIPGWIDYKKVITIKDNEIILIALANEREEKREEKVLYARTHYKSDALNAY